MRVTSAVVSPGQDWSYLEPSGRRIRIRIIRLRMSPSGRVAEGQTPSGRRVMCWLARLERGLHGARLETENQEGG